MICQPQAAAHCQTRTVECRFTPRAAVTLGYRQRDVLTGEPFTKDGRPVAHGDVGHSDERGFVHITGRIKEIVIRSGEKVAAPAAPGCPWTATAATHAHRTRLGMRPAGPASHDAPLPVLATAGGLAAPASSASAPNPHWRNTYGHRSELLGSWTPSRIGSINAAAWRSTAPSLTVLAP